MGEEGAASPDRVRPALTRAKCRGCRPISRPLPRASSFEDAALLPVRALLGDPALASPGSFFWGGSNNDSKGLHFWRRWFAQDFRRPALKLSERADLKQSSLSTCLRLNYSEPSSLLVPSCRKARPSLHRCWRCL